LDDCPPRIIVYELFYELALSVRTVRLLSAYELCLYLNRLKRRSKGKLDNTPLSLAFLASWVT
jgi:hypothetical protein